MRIAFHTLGCKVNQFETGALERLFEARGHVIVPWDAEADAYVINTCTVTAVSDKKSRQAIRGVKRDHPRAVTAVCGCLGQNAPETMLALGADLVCGTGGRRGFVLKLEEIIQHKNHQLSPIDCQLPTEFERLPAGGVAGRTRALLKVQDGCENRCAYCVIPLVRGPARSLPADEAAAEAARLAAEGYREIVITGIEISSYGRDLPAGIDLAALTERICLAAPNARVRLGSLEPRVVKEDFAARLAVLPNLCPHFHLALQSGCDDTLRRMGRRYDTARFARALERLRTAFPGCAVTTDLIVGFPGEDDGELARTLAFAESCAFAGMHIFPYSRRAGTPAAELPDQVPRAQKRERAVLAAALAKKMTRAFDMDCVGRVFRVLFEEDGGGARGHAGNYRPVRCPGADARALRGQIRPVLITGTEDGELIGALME